MQPVTQAEGADHAAATAGSGASAKNITKALSQVHIDAGLSPLTPHVPHAPAQRRSQAQSIQLAADASSSTAKPLSPGDRIRHDMFVSASQSKRFEWPKLPVHLRDIDVRVAQGFAAMLQRHLDEGRIGDAVDLFGALGNQLCASQLQADGLRLWPQVLEHLGADTSLSAGVAWLRAARLHEAVDGPAEPTLQAYERALEILSNPQFRLGAADIQDLEPTRDRAAQLQSFEAAMAGARKMLERNDANGAQQHLTRALTLEPTLRREIRCLELAGDIAAARGSLMAVHYYQAAANRANSKPDMFKAEANEAIAKRDGLHARLGAPTVKAAAAACIGSQPTLDKLLLNAAQQWVQHDPRVAARMFDDLIPRLVNGDMESACAVLVERRLISIDIEDGETARLNLELVPVLLQLGQGTHAALCLAEVLNDANAMKRPAKSLQVAVDVFTSHGMSDVAQWCEAARQRPFTPQDVQTLHKHLATLVLLPAARDLAEDDPATAGHMLDHAIPHLVQSGDMKSALGALLDRRNISTGTDDGHEARLNLQLVPVYLALGESANAVFCLSNVLSSDEPTALLHDALKAAVALFEKHGMANAVQWCQAATTREVKAEDAPALEGHVLRVLALVVGDVSQQAAGGNFDPLLKHAEDLVANGLADQVAGIFETVIVKHQDIDAKALATALDDHLKEVATPEDHNAISVALQKALAQPMALKAATEAE